MKIFGIFLIIITGTGIGIVRAQQLAQRTAILRCFDYVMDYTKSQIRYVAAPISSVIKDVKHHSAVYSICDFLECVGHSLDWENELQKCDFCRVLTADDKRLIVQWGNGLGRSDVAGQLHHCEQSANEIKKQIENAREQAATKGKLYACLGLAGGATLALLWI